MTTIADLIFAIAPQQMKARFLVTFLMQIMQQRRGGVTRKLPGQVVETRENRQQARFWIRRGHAFYGFSQLRERRQQFIFDGRIHGG